MSTSKLFGKDIFITSTTEATSNTVGAFSTLGGINVTKTILTAGGINSISNTNTLGNIFTTGGNIGIGTTAPTQTLSVAGNFNFTGSLFQNGSVYSGSTQWGSTGANIYYNTGRVGLGTLSPSGLLSLNGTSSSTVNGPHIYVNVDNGVYPIYQQLNWGYNNIAKTFDGYWDGQWKTSTSGTAFQIYKINNQLQFNYANGSAGSVVPYNISMVMDSRGNIGIGTTTPNESLHTLGEIRVDNTGGTFSIYIDPITGGAGPQIQFANIGVTSGDLMTIGAYNNVNNIDTKSRPFYIFNSAGNVLLFGTTSGNVGIGTTSPGTTLDINGNFRKTYELGYSNDTALVSGWYNIGSMNMPGSGRFKLSILGDNGYNASSTPGGECVIIGSINNNSPSNVVNINGTFYQVNGSPFISSVKFTQGADKFTYNILCNFTTFSLHSITATLSSGTYTRAFTTTTDPGANSATVQAATNTFSIGSGNVGIGTTAPSATLDVFGTIEGITSLNTNFSAPNTLQNTASINNPSVLALLAPNMPTSGTTNFFTGRSLTSNNACDVQYAYTGSGSTQNSMRLGFYGQPTYTMSLLANGNVGIGTTAPPTRLSVQGGGLHVVGNTAISTPDLQGAHILWNRSLGEGETWLVNQPGLGPGSIRFGTSNTSNNLTEWMRLASSGNVGIGTTSPSRPLVVNLAMRIGGSGAVLDFGDNTTTQIYRNGTTSELRLSTNTTDRMTITSTGNVGIGITTPTQMLHLQRSGNDNYLKIDAGSTTSQYSGLMLSEHNINFGWTFRFNAGTDLLHVSYQDNTPAFTDMVTFTRTNRVGINTTSPSYDLDVNGGMRSQNIALISVSNSSGWTPASTTTSIFAGIAATYQINVTGSNGYNSSTGLYVAPVSGYYNISIFVRFSDSVTDIALRPFKIVSGVTNYLIGGDNSIWVPNDAANRRTVQYVTIEYFNAGESFGANCGYNGGGAASIANVNFGMFYLSR